MIKIILAYITLNYGIEPSGSPPVRKVIGDAALPLMSEIVRVRRKQTETQ